MRLPHWLQREPPRGHDQPAPSRPYLRPAIEAVTAPLGRPALARSPGPEIRRLASYLRCVACGDLMDRNPNCSDLAVLTLHWMTEHRERWVKMHPESAEYLP